MQFAFGECSPDSRSKDSVSAVGTTKNLPVAACLKILCTDVLLPKVRAWTAGEAQDPLPIDRD